VSTVYASPIFEATPGSNHGYDGVNPHQINPKVGSIEKLSVIREKLNAATMGWLQDIVPNHMAFHPNNTWLNDVLEKGRYSPYAPFFDIASEEKLMVPFLGSSLENVIEQGELKIAIENGKPVFKYFEST